VIEDFTVEDDDGLAIGARHGLSRGIAQIENRKPPVAEDDPGSAVGSLRVGPSIVQDGERPVHCWLSAIEHRAENSAHSASLLLDGLPSDQLHPTPRAASSLVAEMSGPVLYISFDGILQPLGFSQVARVVAGIAKKGIPYHLLSVERHADLGEEEKVASVRRLLDPFDVRWTPIAVDLVGSPYRSAEAFARIGTAATSIVRKGVGLVHARGYQAALVAQTLRRLFRVPYLFDARGYWIDERVDWFANRTAYAIGKWTERGLYRDARAIVTLTDLHARDLPATAPIVTIPTCADYDEFTIHEQRPSKPTPELDGKLVLAVVGAANRSYAIEPSIRLAKAVCEARPDAHLLVLTRQSDEYQRALARVVFPADRCTFVAAAHSDMPRWLDNVDWGFLLLPDIAAKRGSMPTKLAEFFASGVRPIAHGCNVEMVSWVRRAGSGLVLDTLDPGAIDEAAKRVIGTPSRVEELRNAREITAPHFSLASGIERYVALLRPMV